MSRSYTYGVCESIVLICGVFYPDCVGQGSASELTSLRSPRDLNGNGYFHARLGWTGFGLRANIVEKYVLFSAMLHMAVALERNRADPVVHLVVTLRRKFLGSCGYVREPWRLIKTDAGRVSTFSSFARRICNNVRWLWVLAYVSAFNKVGSLFW